MTRVVQESHHHFVYLGEKEKTTVRLMPTAYGACLWLFGGISCVASPFW